jgi:hypothetical protein
MTKFLNRPIPRLALIGAALCLAGAEVRALKIAGTVREVRGNVAIVVTDGDVVPATGDHAQIFFNIPGSNNEISVASGVVIGRVETTVQVRIKQASGSVMKNHGGVRGRLRRQLCRHDEEGSPGNGKSKTKTRLMF